MKKIQDYKKEQQSGSRTELINFLIDRFGYQRHLEIGMDCGKNFKKIKCKYKVGVDPAVGEYSHANPTYPMTSDEFFKQNKEMFDIVFVDGLHEHTQVYRDIVNSLNVLNDGGTIVCHDMNPLSEDMQAYPRPTGRGVPWNGDCWKAFVQLRMERSDLKMFVIDADWGLGIIQRGQQETIKETELTYENFDKNRNSWLNLISEDEFYRNYNN
jgi:hypothetical protein